MFIAGVASFYNMSSYDWSGFGGGVAITAFSENMGTRSGEDQVSSE
jgi:hypothetical protein